MSQPRAPGQVHLTSAEVYPPEGRDPAPETAPAYPKCLSAKSSSSFTCLIRSSTTSDP
jgi:hypothetical protein